MYINSCPEDNRAFLNLFNVYCISKRCSVLMLLLVYFNNRHINRLKVGYVNFYIGNVQAVVSS